MRSGEEIRRPVVYLDIDDVLIRWEGHHREAASHAAEFVRFLLQRFEVRWISSWCPEGTMREDRLVRLGDMLNLDPDELRPIRNPRAFEPEPFGRPPKYQAVDLEEARPWFWIEDEGVRAHSREALERAGLKDRWIECNTSRRPDDLLRVRKLLEKSLRHLNEEGP